MHERTTDIMRHINAHKIDMNDAYVCIACCNKSPTKLYMYCNPNMLTSIPIDFFLTFKYSFFCSNKKRVNMTNATGNHKKKVFSPLKYGERVLKCLIMIATKGK